MLLLMLVLYFDFALALSFTVPLIVVNLVLISIFKITIAEQMTGY